MSGRRAERTRVLRVIARMNMGGPAYHVSLLSGRLDPNRYETLLVTGTVGPGEASLEHLAAHYGARVRTLGSLGPELRTGPDADALRELSRIVRSFRPHIVHTHTAKAGILGRLAARTLRPRPLAVHTYHGHVLEGYFGAAKNAAFRRIERTMARGTDCLIGVSAATVDDLVRLRIAPRSRFRIVPIGLELDHFTHAGERDRREFRAEIGAADEDVVATYVGRLVPIKRVQLAMEAVARARRLGAPLRLAVVGDGTCRAVLESRAAMLRLEGSVAFTGYRGDLPAVVAGSDIAVLSSDNEGTPVSLIEAAAGRRPAVATSVGGVPEVVAPGTGILVPRGGEREMAEGLAALAANPEARASMGDRAAEHVLERYGAARLLSDIDALYQELLATTGARAPALTRG